MYLIQNSVTLSPKSTGKPYSKLMCVSLESEIVLIYWTLLGDFHLLNFTNVHILSNNFINIHIIY